MAYRGRVDPVGKDGKGRSRGSAYTCVQVSRSGGPDSGRGGRNFERPGSGRHRRTHRRMR